MHVTALVWIVTIAVAVGFLALDVLVIGRRPHEPTIRECAIALACYLAAAVLFGLGVLAVSGPRYGTEFIAGWLTEYSLSVDNLFVFLIIMARLAVPRQLQQSALLIGIVLALLLRGLFIALGAAAINTFSWVFYLFGAFLVYTAVKLATEGAGSDSESDSDSQSVADTDADPATDEATDEARVAEAGRADGADPDDGRIVRWLRRRIPSTDSWEGSRLTVKRSGRRLLTPMAVVIVALGTTDLLFALDSIPAIYGLTSEPYLVLTANLFALMGLRQLYFLIGGMLRRLVYLSVGLAVMLAFIGVKLVLHALHENSLPFLNSGDPVGWAPDIPIWLSLTVILGVLTLTTAASLAKTGGARALD